jgi:pilus assembly protein Flp/PilA
MLTLAIKLKDLLLREDGQDLVEYALIISLIALACITGVGGFGVLLQGLMTTINAAAASILG